MTKQLKRSPEGRIAATQAMLRASASLHDAVHTAIDLGIDRDQFLDLVRVSWDSSIDVDAQLELDT